MANRSKVLQRGLCTSDLGPVTRRGFQDSGASLVPHSRYNETESVTTTLAKEARCGRYGLSVQVTH